MTTEPLTRAQAIAIATETTTNGKPLCQPNGCHENDLEPCSGDIDGRWICARCESVLSTQIALAFQDDPIGLVNQAIVYMHAGTIVLHVQAMITGRIKQVYLPHEYRDKDGNVIDRHVVQFVDGNAFILSTDERTLMPLTAHQVAVLEQLSTDMRTLIVGTFAALRMPNTKTKEGQDERMATAVLLLRVALTQQLRALG